jgi:uncharacterized protein
MLILSIVAVAFCCCSGKNNANDQPKTIETRENKKLTMEKLVSMVEIPTTDFQRASNFYKAVLHTTIEETEIDGIRIGLFPNDGTGVFVQLIKGAGYKPSQDGSIVYIAVEQDMKKVLEAVEANGGQIVTPKTSIAPDMGYYALFIDTEGNKLGLHSNE